MQWLIKWGIIGVEDTVKPINQIIKEEG